MNNFFHLSEIIDVDALQKIQDYYSKATSLAVVTVDYTGDPITKFSNFSKYCSIMREDPECNDGCCRSDAHGGLEAARIGKPYIYTCHGGLVDFAIPIVLEGQYLGSIMAGQVKLDKGPFDIEKCREQVDNLWHDNAEVINAYNEIPIISYEKIDASANMMYIVANQMVEKGLANVYQEELNKKNLELLEETKIKSELEKSLKTAELKALQSRLNPHFLFNVLNTIGNLALLEGATKTEELVISFSEILRYTLENSNQFVTLATSIEYIKKYLSIQKTRFGDRLEYNIDIQEELLDINIPFMTLQPFVENSIIHGLECKEGGGIINITAKSAGKDAVISIVDNGVGIPKDKLDVILDKSSREYFEDKSTCIGIKNVDNILKGYFGEKYGISIDSKLNKGTIVTIKIPKTSNPGGALSV